MTNEHKLAMLKQMLKRLDDDYEQLIKRHGTGVRPSWVSTDLSLISHKAALYRKAIAEIEGGQTDA